MILKLTPLKQCSSKKKKLSVIILKRKTVIKSRKVYLRCISSRNPNPTDRRQEGKKLKLNTTKHFKKQDCLNNSIENQFIKVI